MKIALACRVYPIHRPGGMPFVCQDRAIALAAQGHEVHVLTTGLNGHQSSMVVGSAGLQVHHMPCKAEAYSDEYAEHCLRHCTNWKPDIVHMDSLDVRRLWWIGLKAKTACTLHGFCWGSFLTAWNLYKLGGAIPHFDAQGMMIERNALATLGTVIGVSIHEHWMLKDLMGLPQAKLVYNPIPDYFFTKLVPPPATRRFLCAAISGQTVRQFDTAVEAAYLAGVSLVQAHGLPREQMPAQYDAVSGLVVPTAYAQGYDLTVAEALARGRPVLCSATGSYLRESAYASTGLLTFPLGDVKALAALMTGPLHSPWGWIGRHRPNQHTNSWLRAILND